MSDTANNVEKKLSQRLHSLPPTEEIVKILECPVCYQIPLPPVWNCWRGHLICNSCRPRLQACPVCRCKLADFRNSVIESIILCSKFTCEYRSRGCETTIDGTQIQRHKFYCRFRPMRCHLGASNGCNYAEVNYASYFDHLVNVHKVIGGKEEDEASVVIRQKFRHEIQNDKHYWVYTYKKFDGEIFLCRSYRLGYLFYWDVVLIGSDLEASKYGAKITIERKREQVPKFEVTIPIASIRNSRGIIEEDLPHAMLTENQLQYFCTPIDIGGGKIKYQWRTQYRILKINQCVQVDSNAPSISRTHKFCF